ncbi:SNF2 domain protein [Oribacterium sp. oral taxon 078 str. F0263]|uniref:DEAD/DEAH box helicase n=1 Tax=Oribacterium sp. oral taxon 078 TaxID=652706 RepID=UPI0003AD78DA|nr:DEAD/DEAH box helicase [Oribacterium sp. oral taxon 078]ERL19798.1 SNF2 domain protein [Oribacterium sp. oral taxon 078 str. F0263]
MYDYFNITKVLVIAPLRVAEDTWSRESEKWDHLKDLRISKILGTAAQRKAAAEAEADIYVINRENVVWLVENCKRWDFDMIVIDELSSFKSPQSKRFRALRKVIVKSPRVIGLTGTPSPNSLMDLWAQVYLLDRGERLGRTLGAYREEFFQPGARNGYIVYKWDLRKGAREAIEKRISDLCVSMSAKDYLTLPKRIDNVIPIKLSEQELGLYKTLESEQLLHLSEEDDIVALSAAAVMTKLLQIANGRAYNTEGEPVDIHRKKLEALQEIIEDTDSPVLVFYSFRHDLEAIRGSIPEARELGGPKDIKDWNEGRVRILLAHPASVGYGLNLQDGGHTIVWYGLTWSLELYQQANARLYRQGQEKPVIIHHLVAEGTVDEQVMKALEAKDMSQAALLAALKERRTK